MTTTHRHLTIADLERMTRDDRWLGFGYLGERENLLHNADPEAPANPELVARMDADVLEEANTEGLSYEELFEWANSKLGRWFADCHGTRHAVNYLPTRARVAAIRRNA